MKVEKLNNNRVKFTFEVTPEEFEIGLNYSYDQIKDEVQIKGFRKGKASRSQYEKKYGVESLYEEALNFVIYQKYMEIANYKEQEVVGQPKVDLDITQVEVGKSFELVIEAPVKPEITLGEYKGVEVEKIDTDVTKEEIEEQITQILRQHESLIPVEEGILENGHIAILDFEGFVDDVAFEGGKAENHELEIGSNSFIPGFEDQMVGMKPGEERDLNVKFPEEYHSDELAGKDAVFKVVLHEIKAKQLPELTDEFVAGLERHDVKTVEELKADLEKVLKDTKEENAKVQMAEKILEKIVESLEVDLPEEMIEFDMEQARKQIEQQAQQYGLDYEMYITLTGMTEEALNEQLREQSTKKIINSLIIEKIIELEEIKASAEKIEEKYTELATHYQMPVEEIKKHIQDDMVSQEIEYTEALDLLVEKAVLK